MTTKENKVQVLNERLSEIAAVSLKSGNHKEAERQFCVMEAVAYVAGEPWSNAPQCACPVITAFMVSWNDSLPSDAERDRLLKPLIPLIVGTRSTKQVEERRSYMALDWLIRVSTPKWLDLRPELAEHAAALRDHAEIADLAGATAAGVKVRAAWDAGAWDAGAWDAGASNAAAAGAAAWDAAWAAAWDAPGAWEAAGAAGAWDDAWDAAAGAAAGAAAAGAAALKPTTEWLQASAIDLVKRMIEVKL